MTRTFHGLTLNLPTKWAETTERGEPPTLTRSRAATRPARSAGTRSDGEPQEEPSNHPPNGARPWR